MKKSDIIKMKISRVQKEIRDTPYDKSSEHHHARLKAKLARLMDEFEGPMNKGGGGGGGYAVKHSGDACVVLAGLPSVGKSTLLNALTNADSKVGNYDFTTLGVVPGMMEYKGIRFQILDLPGIVRGASRNIGFGRRVISVIRASDLVILMTDVSRSKWLDKMEKELYAAGLRLNGEIPMINVKKTSRGAIQVVDAYKSFDKETVIGVAKELGFSNAVIQLEERIKSIDRLIDGLTKSRKYMPAIKVVNKIDSKSDVGQQGDGEIVFVSAEKGLGLEILKETMWEKVGLLRVFLKKSRKGAADREKPLVVKKGACLDDVVKKISSQMAVDVGSAYIWGKGARFAGQKVSLGFKVFDQMEVWFGR